MADTAVELVLNNLKELVDHHSHLIRDSSGQIESLQRNLLVFNAFLKDSVEQRRNDDEHTKAMVKEIREVVYEVEDIIDPFLSKTMAKKIGISSLPKFVRTPVDLHAINQQVETVRERIERARDLIGIVSLEDEHKFVYDKDRPPRKKDVVGFEDEVQDLIHRLKTESEYLDVISVIGMLGLGKTTLAWKVFKDPDIISKFSIRIWLSISQEFLDRDIFLAILKEFTTITEDILNKKEEELVDLVIAFLESESFLIVMDDVRDIPHWRRLSLALPYRSNKSKVLITSRNNNVGKFASHPNPIKTLRFFTQEESWDLLQLEALHGHDCPPNLEIVGRRIAENCEGLPLAIVLIGSILAVKCQLSDISATEEEWEKVSTRVSTYLSENDPEKRMKRLISLSYDRLPNHLRSCFLYFGMFREDCEISVSKLIRMWIGEGFIQHNDSCSLEETAEKYLEELIDRELVKSEKLKHDGKVKTCRIHPILRDFCCTEAANENLVNEIKYFSGEFTPPITDIDKYRRLSIHSNISQFIWSKPFCPHVRSFVSFSKEDFVVSDQNSSNIFTAFKFLRVLDVEPFILKIIDICHLFQMRYLVFSSNLYILPSRFNRLWNIQTLVIYTTSRTLEVKADIWNMKKLRYFMTNASANLLKPNIRSEHCKELHTLGTISVESCTPELFNQASNLKKLGIRGNLSLLLDGRNESLDSLGKMEHMQKLKLINDVYPLPPSESSLRGLPEHHQFPPGLISLTLCATFLSWDAMSTLGLLKKLKVLKLKDHAVTGSTWKTIDGGFQCLELLLIQKTDLIVWHASSFHFPKLRRLVLLNCEKLLAIPIGLADTPSFQTLDLFKCNSVAASARYIMHKKEKDTS